MRFATVSEGKTDYIVLRNLLVGFSGDKNLPVARILPEADEPVGWGNLLNYLSTDKFREIFEFNDYVIVQIDSDKCEEWKESLHQIGADSSKIDLFVQDIKNVLIRRIGEAFYNTNKGRILFAISVQDIECWLLPFNATLPAHYSKTVGCVKALEYILKPKGISLHQKNYNAGKHYDDLSKGMKNNKELMQKCILNPSLKIFVDTLLSFFPPPAVQQNKTQDDLTVDDPGTLPPVLPDQNTKSSE
jgi:hypothetical protein